MKVYCNLCKIWRTDLFSKSDNLGQLFHKNLLNVLKSLFSGPNKRKKTIAQKENTVTYALLQLEACVLNYKGRLSNVLNQDHHDILL
jgi:hypothetical protein